MDVRQGFPSKYVGAADLSHMPSRSIKVRMAKVALERMPKRDGGDETKPVLYFEQAKKGLVLNRTNATKIGSAFGWETDAWAGHVIELYVAEVEAFGETTEAIRVRIPQASQSAFGAPAALPPPARPKTRPIEPPPEDEPLPASAFDEPAPGTLDGDGSPF